MASLLCRDGIHTWVGVGSARVCLACDITAETRCHHSPTRSDRCDKKRGHDGEHVSHRKDGSVSMRWES